MLLLSLKPFHANFSQTTSYADSLAKHVIVVNRSLRREYKHLLLKLTEIIFTVTVLWSCIRFPWHLAILTRRQPSQLIAHMHTQPRSQGPLSSSRKYPGYGLSRVYTCQLQTHRGWVLNKLQLQLQLQLSSPSLRSYLRNLLKSSRHVTSRNQGTFSR